VHQLKDSGSKVGSAVNLMEVQRESYILERVPTGQINLAEETVIKGLCVDLELQPSTRRPIYELTRSIVREGDVGGPSFTGALHTKTRCCRTCCRIRKPLHTGDMSSNNRPINSVDSIVVVVTRRTVSFSGSGPKADVESMSRGCAWDACTGSKQSSQSASPLVVPARPTGQSDRSGAYLNTEI
jgi:hypothetical protein